MENAADNKNFTASLATDFQIPDDGRAEIEALFDKVRDVSEKYGVPCFMAASLGRLTTKDGDVTHFNVRHEIIGGHLLPQEKTPDEFYAMAMIEQEGVVGAAPKLAMWALGKKLAGEGVCVTDISESHEDTQPEAVVH